MRPPKLITRGRVPWILAWGILTISGVLIHSATWVAPHADGAGLSALAEYGFMKQVGNAVDTIVGPVWLALALVTGDWGVFSVFQSTIAHGVTAALIVLGIRWLRRLRMRVQSPSPDRSEPQVNFSRRRLLIDAPLGAAALLGGGTVVNGAFLEPFDLRMRRYEIPIKGISESLAGLRAIFIADTHLGPRIPGAYIADVVKRTIALRPDLVLLGGDYVHCGRRYIEPAVALFRPLIEAGLPTAGVLGNHDWYNSRGIISKHLSEIGVRMVDNAHVLFNGKTRRFAEGSLAPSEALCIAGVGDLSMDAVDIHGALQDVPDSVPRLVLSHNPDAAELAPMRGETGRTPPRVDLMLSGHMHGGQIALPLLGPIYVPSKWGRKYAGGLVQGPAFPVLVSRGVGMSICPVRIGVPPELVEITLVPA